MKINKLINSFKAGLMSQIMRSRLDIKDVVNACEEIDNFHVLPVGGANRRMGLVAKKFNPLSGDDSFKFEDTGEYSGYSFNIEGEDFYFLFNTANPLNGNYLYGVAYPPEASSNFCRIFDSEGNEQVIRVFGGYYETGPFQAFNGFNNGSYQNEFHDYLQNQFYPKQLNYSQLSAKTVMFCDPSGSSIPFYITRDHTPDPAGSLVPKKYFILAPWCCDYSMLARTYNSNYYVPMTPNVVPYGLRNTNTSYVLGVTDIYAGAECSSGTRYKVTGTPHTEKWMKIVAIPKQVLPEDWYTANNPTFTKGAGIWFKGFQAFDGKEFAGFAHKYHSQNATHVAFYATFSVGGDYAVDTSDFALSIWNGITGFPKTVNVHRGLPCFANAGVEKNGIYFGAINANNLAGFQNFMQSTLYQDASTDGSGIMYFSTADKASRGFNLLLNEGKTHEIKWIFSRRNLHIGTGNGEHQLLFTDSATQPLSERWYAIKVGSTQSVNIQPVEGDRKIFYVTDNGKVIRVLSVENKDYDSVDLELTNFLVKLPSPVIKMQWSEAHRSLLALTESGLVYAFTISELNQVVAPSTLSQEHEYPIVDIIANGSGYRFILSKLTTPFPAEYTNVIAGTDLDLVRGVDITAERAKFLDTSISYIVGTTNIEDFFELHRGKTLSCYKNASATEYTVNVPIGYNKGDSLSFLPANVNGDTLSIGMKYLSKLITFPIEDGSRYGSPIGDVKRIDRATVMLHESGKCEIGNPDSSTYEVENLSNTAYSTVNANVDFPDSPDTMVRVLIQTDEPVPLTVIGASFRMVDYEGE